MTETHRVALGAALLALGVATGIRAESQAGPGAPPHETLVRLDEAAALLDQRDFTGAYSVQVTSVRSKLDGSDARERVERYRARKRGSDPVEGELVQSLENGRDVTLERRAEAAPPQRASGGRGGGLGALRRPGAAEAAAYRFRTLERAHGVCTAAFEPAPGADGEGLTRGRLAWDCLDLDPVWLEVQPVETGSLVDSVRMRWEFGRVDGFLHTRRFEAGGSGGLPFFKRKMQTVVEVTELQLGAP